MSKSVRLPDYLAAEVERLAKVEKRSLANMVQLLLEQALKIDARRVGPDERPVLEPAGTQPARPGPDSHFKPDFKK
jgi:hypothetical protein